MRGRICLVAAMLAAAAGVVQAFRPVPGADLKVRTTTAPPADLKVRTTPTDVVQAFRPARPFAGVVQAVRPAQPFADSDVVQAFRPARGFAFQGRQRGEDLSEYLPPGAGKALVAKQCSGCHDLRGTIQLRKTREGWEAIVIDMVARGAPVMLEEVDPIIAYLGEAFGSTAPPLVDVNTAPREDLLKLPGVTAAVADRLIEHRTANGALSSRDQVRTMLGLDEGAFDKIKWYVKVGKAGGS